MQRKCDLAVSLCETCLQPQKRSLRDTYSLSLKTMNDLAILYDKLGKNDVAEKMIWNLGNQYSAILIL